MIALTEARWDADGAHFWKRGPNGERIEIGLSEFERLAWTPPTPIYDQVLDDLGACLNCRCADCGCCVGCGQVDADYFGVHGCPGCV